MLKRVILVLWLASAPVAADTTAASALWQKGDYRAAFAEAFEPAQQGDPHAQFLIGEAYRLGRSVDPDFLMAEDWYARAARQGDVAAATELGLLHAGRHEAPDALPWLAFAAAHGEPRALCSLAALYFNGDGVPPDQALAYALMARAAAAGLGEAGTRLATLRSALTPDELARGEALARQGWTAALPPVPPASPPPPAPVAPAAPASAPVRIQVGAFRSARAAEQAWSLLAGMAAGFEGADHAVVRAGAIFRLQARLPDQEAADRFARQLGIARWQHFVREGNAATPTHG